MIKIIIGLMVAFLVGVGCRAFGVPLPGPPAILGAAMAVAMACGYTASDRWLSQRAATNSTQPSSADTATQDQSGLHGLSLIDEKK